MQNITSLSDETLLTVTKSLALRERELTVEILHHLREVEFRQLFSRLGFSSLYEYAVKELGYSEGSAHRRISSMRLLKILPQIESKIETGALPLSTLSQAQTFFRQEKITQAAVKLEVLAQLEGKSAREVEKALVMASSEPARLKPERVRAISGNFHQLSLNVSSDLVKKLDELKALLSHRNPAMSLAELLGIIVDESLEKHRIKAPKVKPTSNAGADGVDRAPNTKKPVTPPTRYIPREVKRRVWFRDGGKCSYVDPKTGRTCAATHFLEYDHLQPVALGGISNEENLRLRCRTHNRLAAIDTFGADNMRTFVNSMAR